MAFDESLLEEEPSSGFDESLLVPEEPAVQEKKPSFLKRVASGFKSVATEADPASLMLSPLGHSVTGRETADAMDYIDAVNKVTLESTQGKVPKERFNERLQEVLGEMPIRPPTTGEQVATGLQNVAAENLTSPAALAFPILPAPLQRAAGVYFGIHGAMQVPEAARRAGEASVTGTPLEKTKAYAELGLDAALPVGLAASEVPRLRQLIPKGERIPDAIQREAETAVRDVSAQPREGAGEVPIEGTGPKDVERGSEEVPKEVLPEVQRDVELLEPKTVAAIQEAAIDESKPFKQRAELIRMPQELWNEMRKDYKGKYSGSATGLAYDLGSTVKTPADLEVLKAIKEDYDKQYQSAKAAHDFTAMGQAQLRSQTAHEAYQAATGVKIDGSAGGINHVQRFHPEYEPPLPHENYKAPEAKAGKGVPEDGSSVAQKALLAAGNAPQELAPAAGPGAATPSDIGTPSQISQLTQTIQNTVSPKQTMAQRVQSAIATIKGVPKTAGQAVKTGVQKLAAVTGAIKSGLTKLPTFTDFKRSLGIWDGADQIAAHETRKFVNEINKRIPKNRQEAMNNWIQADGDIVVLQQRAAATTDRKLKRGYEEAQNLTNDEKIAAQNIGNYYDAKLQEGLASGLLEHGLENYINHVWKKPNPVTQKLQADLAMGKLNTNFKFARQRIFEHYFEGEQAGYTPANKAVGALIGIYDQSFNRALSARGFVKNLTTGKASDGRDLVAVSGSAGLVPPGTTPPDALLVRPKTKPEEAGDYRSLDHPALRKWMWQTKTPEGTPVMVQGDLLVHPEIYQHLKNVLGKSAWRQNKFGKAILATESTIKQTMFSASGFHQTQETLHALGHRVNPANLSKIDFNNPIHREAVEHGLQLASYDAMEQFTDGLGSGPLINKIPLIGKRILGPYTEWLFQDYIPRLKMTMYEHALERNTERYQDQISSGQMTRDQLLELTGKQSNAAFGELNYNWMGRNKNMQDALRTFLVAPDFLEARTKFVGQALRSHGREQLMALGLLAATQYIASRVLNKALDDDYHWNKPFSLVVKKHEYELRSVPGDIAHLISDPKKFITSRLAPIARAGVEFVTGRDWRGVKRDTLDQIKDFAKLPIPISLRRQDDQRWWETFLNAFGVHERSATASQETADRARQFREKAKGKPEVEIIEAQDSPYRKLRTALDVGREKDALAALQELRKNHKDSQILRTMREHMHHPFTGTKALENRFKQSLEPSERAKYTEAMVERRERYRKFQQVWTKRGQKEKPLQTTQEATKFDPSLLVPE